jgi:hypothetical protein
MNWGGDSGRRQRPRGCVSSLRACCRLGGASLVGAVKAIGRPGAGSRGLNLTIARRNIRDKRIKQLVRGFGHLVNRPAKCDLVCFGGSREAAQLPDELQGRGMDFLVRGRRFEIVQSLDVSTHDNPHRRLTAPRQPGLRARNVADGCTRLAPQSSHSLAGLRLTHPASRGVCFRPAKETPANVDPPAVELHENNGQLFGLCRELRQSASIGPRHYQEIVTPLSTGRTWPVTIRDSSLAR